MKKRSFITRSAAILLGITLGFSALPSGTFKSEPVKAAEITSTTGSSTVETVGDINGDGEINAKDVTMLRRHLAGGWGVTVNEEDADINGDGEVNAKDVTMLRRYLAGGWGVELREKFNKQYNLEVYFGGDYEFRIRKIDREGRVIKETSLESDMPVEFIEYQYDNNRRISGAGHDEDGNQIKLFYEYVNGKVIENKKYYNRMGEERNSFEQEKVYDLNDNILEHRYVQSNYITFYDYILDAHGRISDIIYSSKQPDGSKYEGDTCRISYDEKGNILKEEWYTPEEILYLTTSWDYSNPDIIIVVNQWNDEDDEIEYYKEQGVIDIKYNTWDGSEVNEKYYLDNDGNIIKRQYSVLGEYSYEYLYDSKEKIKQKTEYDELGHIVSRYQYLEDGSILKYGFVDDEGKYVEIESIIIDEEQFPDEAFREYILTDCDTDKNGVLDALEIQRTEYLDCNNLGISNLEGLEVFENLKGLYCENNKIEELDLSKAVKLETLWCSKNMLAKLDVSKNINLKYLECYSNSLRELDVSKNADLIKLSCQDNALELLDVSNNVSLEELSCGRNQIRVLNLDNNTLLERLYCSDSPIEELKLGKINALKRLECKNCNLKSLIMDDNQNLVYINCDNNQLDYIDVSNKPELTELWCQKNKLTELNLNDAVSLTVLNCDDNQIEQLDLSENADLKYLWCQHNTLTSLDLNNNTSLLEVKCGINQIDTILLSNNTIIEELGCQKNNLSGIDLRNNTKLKELECSDNNITSLDVSQNTELEWLSAVDNQLSFLDVTNNPLLEYLAVDFGKMTIYGWWERQA